MNLYSLPHRSWSPSLLSSITNNDPIETARLEKMLGQVEREKKSAGRVGGWFRGRYGFGEGEVAGLELIEFSKRC